MLHRLLTATTVAMALSAATSIASAQETYSGEVPAWGPVTLEFELREITFVPGEETAFAIPSGTDNTYSDLFSTGFGFGLQVAMPFFMQDTASPTIDITIGPLIGFDRVTMPGEDFDNPGGTSVFSPDDWSMTTVYIGGQARMKMGDILSPVRFLIGAEIAIGTVFFEDVDAELSFNSGATSINGPMYDASTDFVFRAMAHFGMAIRLSEQFDLNVLLYGGIASQGTPEDNTDASNPFIPADPDGFVPFVVGFTISLRMRTG